MTICLPDNSYKYEIESVVKLFYPAMSFDFLLSADDISGDYCWCYSVKNSEKTSLISQVRIGDSTENKQYEINNDTESYNEECEFLLCKGLFLCLEKLTGITPSWGLLTGVRPVKRINTLLSEGKTKDYIFSFLKEKYLVSEEKINLAWKTSQTQSVMLKSLDNDSFSLYISIPFCPSRCSYCSFISNTCESSYKIIPLYVENLCKEIKHTAKLVKELSLKLDTVYFGGGTPTAISACQLESIMKTIAESFDMSYVREYTVEAGRADTITEEKLLVIKRNGATRISINPQTFNDNVLKAIGRKHTVKDVLDSFALARRLGFDNINMDLIAGLPEDTAESFEKTIEKVIELNPENVTVHTLYIKRCSDLRNDSSVLDNPAPSMVAYADKRLLESGYNPYYLYRQKNTLGNLENTGFSKQGKESLYNIYIMEEVQTIIALGAGASTKLVEDGNIERVYNFKFPLEYNNHFDTMLERKNLIRDFYKRRKV